MSNNPKQPLIIAEQGSFAIGGSTLKHDGVSARTIFLNQKDRLPMGTMPMPFTRYPWTRVPIRSFFSTAALSANGHGKRRLMAAKAFRPFFCARVTRRSSSTSPAWGKPVLP